MSRVTWRGGTSARARIRDGLNSWIYQHSKKLVIRDTIATHVHLMTNISPWAPSLAYQFHKHILIGA